MTVNELPPEEPTEDDRGHSSSSRPAIGRLLPGSTSLSVLLIVFVSLSLLTLFSIVRGGVGHVGDDAGGLRAFKPADFPEIEFDRPLPHEVEAVGVDDAGGTYRVPPPPFSEEGIYPCSECHADMEVDTARRELEDFHDDIELEHGPADRWCFDCHNPDDRDRLRLANGTLIGFDESYRLCGQCHGTIYRDWREGIHGRRVGYWNGAKSYLLCAHCHNPHAPRYSEIEPLPPPVRPQYLASAGEVENE